MPRKKGLGRSNRPSNLKFNKLIKVQNNGTELKSGSKTPSQKRPKSGKKKSTKHVLNYTNYGRSTDLNYSTHPLLRPNAPNPYLELQRDLSYKLPDGPSTPTWLAKANEILRARLKLVTEKNREIAEKAQQNGRTQKSQSAGEDSHPLIDAKTGGDGEGNGSRQTVQGDDASVKEEEEESPVPEEDEDDEEEQGVPQAVRRPCVSTHPPTIIEVIRERQKALMEEVARNVDKKDLISNLKARGFFNYTYYYHQRTKRHDYSQVQDKKRATEKLVSLLSI